jgi:hypothetical protein
MGINVVIPEISLNAENFSSVRLATQDVTYFQRCSRQSQYRKVGKKRYKETAKFDVDRVVGIRQFKAYGILIPRENLAAAKFYFYP